MKTSYIAFMTDAVMQYWQEYGRIIFFLIKGGMARTHKSDNHRNYGRLSIKKTGCFRLGMDGTNQK